MDFNSCTAGQPFYCLTKDGRKKPVLEIGTIKDKTVQPPQYQLQTIPNAMNGMGAQQQLVRITATFNGSDRVFPDVPSNVEIAQKGDTTFTASTQAMMQAIDSMMQTSSAELGRTEYNQMVMEEGDGMIQKLNPRYAEEKQRDKAIKALEQRQDAQDKKLDRILERLDLALNPDKK